MTTTSPLIFRPSGTHKLVAIILCAGSWLVGIQGLILLLKHVPKLMFELNQAKITNEPTFAIWGSIIALALLCFISGLLLTLFIAWVVIIENTNIIVDDAGITVDYHILPHHIAKLFGAGHLAWKHITKLEKNIIFFQLSGQKCHITGNKYDNCQSHQVIKLKFIMVDELDRLILTILERSPNLTIL